MEIRKKVEVIIKVQKDKCDLECDYLDIYPDLKFLGKRHACNLYKKEKFIVPLKMYDKNISYRCPQCIKTFGMGEV